MSVPLQSVPEDQQSDNQTAEDPAITQAKHEAAEIVARARRQAEAIVAESRTGQSEVASPLAALGNNAEEIIGQVRKLIKKQRKLQAEREELLSERDELTVQVEGLVAERDELVQRLTDAVVRMEELASLANQPQTAPPTPQPPRQEVAPPTPRDEPREAPPAPPVEQSQPGGDTSLAARLRHAEEAAEAQPEDTSLAARLRQAEDTSLAARLRQAEEAERDGSEPAAEGPRDLDNDSPSNVVLSADGRSFYSRNSAKLPRLEGDGGRSVLSAVGGMRPETEPKGRKGRRRKRDK